MLLMSLIACASLAAGVLRLPWWTIFVGPAVAIAIGAYEVSTESPDYDMHGFGYYIGGLAAGVCVVGWLLGRVVAALAAPRPQRP